MPAKKYNGHKNWNHWNVYLWINNDEGLYRSALDAVRRTPNRDAAVRVFMELLDDCGLTKTPDGAPYSASAVRGALVGIDN